MIFTQIHIFMLIETAYNHGNTYKGEKGNNVMENHYLSMLQLVYSKYCITALSLTFLKFSSSQNKDTLETN